MCPRFSATRMIATGAIRLIACAVEHRALEVRQAEPGGRADLREIDRLPEAQHVGADVIERVADGAADQDRQAPRQCPAHRPRRGRPPRTVTSAIQRAKAVPAALSGPMPEALLIAIGASTRPIAATIAPVTTGGISRSIQRCPAATTISRSAK